MLRVGIAGIGFIAEEYIKLITKQAITGCEICAMSSRNKQHMEEICDTYHLGHTVLFTDYKEMLKSGLIDAVIICTPHFLHPQMAMEALDRGIHALIEKPVGVFADETELLLQSVRRHPELTTGVLYCQRMNKAFGKLHEIIDSGELGEIKRANWLITNRYRTPAYYRSRDWRGTWKGEGGGLLMTQVSHQLDLLVWLLGMPERIQAFCGFGVEREIEVENEAMIQMWYPGNFTAQFIASGREFPGTNRLEISGSRGQVILENDNRLIYRSLAMDEREYARTSEVMFGSIPFSEEIMEFEEAENTVLQAGIVNDFIQAVAQNRKAICPVEEAVQSLNIINGAYVSSWEKTEVSFPMDLESYRKAWRERTECKG